MKRPARPPRGGFTLVELLMVIAIIGILIALLIVAVQSAVGKANRARTTLEIDNLDAAMQAYRDRANGYPPNFGQADPTVRANRILVHLRMAFPKAPSVTASYADLQNAIKACLSNPNGYPPSTPSGAVWGDVNNLDQAEAVVFWIGGLPSPPLSTSRLMGFSADPRNPFAFGGSRMKVLFEFAETRLEDVDRDGWPEYHPAFTSLTSFMPPYVYFDGPTYTSTPAQAGTIIPWTSITFLSYPSAAGLGPSGMIAEWGVAVPYYDTTTWVNPEKFQIISAGPDCVYGLPGANTPLMPKEFPEGTNYEAGDLDNLANFTSGKLEDAE